MEIWREIPGFEGQYECSDHGRVRSIDCVRLQRNSVGNLCHYRQKGRVLAQRLSPAGYPRVNMSDVDKHLTFQVKDLVCITFLGPPPPVPRAQSALRDGDKHNCALSNVLWATQQEVAAGKVQRGTGLRGDRSHFAKLTWADVANIRSAGGSHRALAAKYGVKPKAIFKIRHNQTWKLQSENA